MLRNLDEAGVIRIGATIKQGDILVGKVTPKGETQLTPEEKLLRAIFGEKAGDVRDASLYCPPGIEGVIVDVKIFSRKGQEKDERAKFIEGTQIAKLEKNLSDEIRILTDERLKRLENILGNKEVLADLHDERTNKKLLTKDTVLDRDTIERISTRNLKRIKYADKDPRVNEQIDEIEEMTSRQIDVLKKIVNERKDKLTKGEELPAVAKSLTRGVFISSPVFDGAREGEIKAMLKQSGLPESGKTNLYDGMTGDKFEQPVTVGYIYMLKLSHLVDDKIHARSIGPYSLITQQPLGGKAQFGGQRFGEMEVWALEAYGSAHILQELLTAKSDDVTGRAKIYEAIVKGDASFTPGLPESFNVLIRELQSLCLDVELISTKKKPLEPVPVTDGEPVLEQV